MILESNTPAVTQFSVGGLVTGNKFKILFPVFNRAEGLKVSVRKKDGSLEELKLNQNYSVLIPSNSGQAGYTAEVEYIGEERSDVYVLIVERVIRLSQETNFSSYGAQGRSEEFSLDKLTCVLQDTRTGLHISSSEVNNPLTGTPELELPYNRENSILAFDENKNVRVIPEYTGGENTEVTDENVINVHIDNATAESDGLMSKEDKVKLDDVQSGAEVNVQSDWNELDNDSDAYIKNKPQLAPVALSNNYNDLDDLPNLSKVALSNNYNDLDNKPALKPVATSGIYNDLTHRPSAEEGIELTNEDWPRLRLKHASAEKLGGIKIGMNLTIDADGTMHAESGIQDLVAGDNIIIDNVGDIQDGIQGAFHSVIYAHGLYVAIGYGVIARSPDGRNWIKNNVVDWFPQFKPDETLSAITSDDTNFIISVLDPACFIKISKDFSTRVIIPFSVGKRIDGVVRLKNMGMYGVYGYTPSTGEGFIRCTTDFYDWSGPTALLPQWFRADHACYVSVSSSERYIFFTGGTRSIVRGTVGGNYIFDLHAAEPMPEEFSSLMDVINTPDGLCVTTASGKIYRSSNFGETWEVWSQPSTSMIDVLAFNDTEYYAAAGGSLFYSDDGGKHWKDSYLGDQYVFSGLYVTNKLIVAAGAKAQGGDGRHLYYIPLGDLTISAIDTTYQPATPWDDGLFEKNDKKKLDDLSPVAISGSYKDLLNKLIAGDNIRINPETNVIDYVGGSVGEELYEAGEHIKIEKNHNVAKCYDYFNTVDILLHREENVVALVYPDKLLLSNVSTKCATWNTVQLPFEYEGYGVVRSDNTMYVVDKNMHVKKSGVNNLTNWTDDGKIPRDPIGYFQYQGASGICAGQEYVVFFAVVGSNPNETAVSYYVDGAQRSLKILPYCITKMVFDGKYTILCSTQLGDIVLYSAEFSQVYNSINITTDSITDMAYHPVDSKLLVLAWSDVFYRRRALWVLDAPYSASVKVMDDLNIDFVTKVKAFKDTFSFTEGDKLWLSNDGLEWFHVVLDKNYKFGIYLEKLSLVKDADYLYRYLGGRGAISATYENASTSADGLMSKEDKTKLNASMKFPDGEAGYTLPNAAGRADKLITFDSNGNVTLHGTHGYDNWRNIRVSENEALAETNFVLPTPASRANKVIGFNADGKSVEMKTAGGGTQVNSDWNATSGVAQILNKPGDIKVSEITDSSMPLSGNWSSVCYSGEMFVAVAQNTNKGAWSFEGDIWHESFLHSNIAWSSVCYGGGKFVAVAQNTNKGAYSSDGITWYEMTLPTSRQWTSVCYGNYGRFVLMSNGEVGMWSTDGITWVLMYVSSNVLWNSVCYGKDKYVAVAEYGIHGAYSINGQDWFRSDISPYNWKSVCYGNGKFFAINNENKVMISDDGMNWSEAILPVTGNWNSVCYGNGKLIAVKSSSNKAAFIPIVSWSLATIAVTGDYKDLLNKPTIPAAQVNSDWGATGGVAQLLNKPTLATVATSGSYNDLSDKLIAGTNITIDGNGVLSADVGDSSGTFINEPVFTGDLVTERIAFVDRGNESNNITCVASFIVNGKKTFFRGSEEYINNAYHKYVYVSHDCITWQKTEVSCRHKITSFLQSGENILFATSLDDVPYDGEVFLSSDGGHSFVRRALSFQYFKGWVESQGNILLCSYHGLYISEDCGNTWDTVPNSVNGIFSSPVFFKGKFYFLRKIKELEDYKNITSITVSDNTFTIEHTFIDNHIPVSLAVDNNYIYAVVKNGTGYPDTYIYSSGTGSNFTLIQTYNNQYTQLLGKPNTWLFISYDKNAWFCKNFSDVPVQVHSSMNSSASNYHYSAATDLFMIQDAGLLVSTKAYIIGS